jgi:predicted nucleic acid-binding protein
VDPDDAPFVALAFAAACPLWTRDKALLNLAAVPTIKTEELAARLGDV